MADYPRYYYPQTSYVAPSSTIDPEKLFFNIIDYGSHLIISAILIYLLVKWVMFFATVYWKRLLIDAFAQQVADEITRCDIETPKELSQKMRDVSRQFMIDGLASVYREQHGILINNTSNEPEVLAKVAEAITTYSDGKFRPFLYERTTLRWAIDGLEALIGDHQSIEVAFEKGTRYLNRFLDPDRKNSLPWFPSYMKLLNLPHNFHSWDFDKQVKKQLGRTYPRGYWSLRCAIWFYRPHYRQRLRIFKLRGEDAWREMIRFKADTLAFKDLLKDD